MLKNIYVALTIVIVTILAIRNVHAQCGSTGAFCGRGPNRLDCCSGYYCNIAPNDAYANCTACGTSKAFCGRGPNRIDCCPGYRCNIAPNDAYAYCVAE